MAATFAVVEVRGDSFTRGDSMERPRALEATTAQPISGRPQRLIAKPTPDRALDLLELEMALDSVDLSSSGFREAVAVSAASLGGEFLFDLPASGLVEDAQKVAAVSLPNGAETPIVFVLLSADGTSIAVQAPGEATADLQRFAEAFMAFHSRL